MENSSNRERGNCCNTAVVVSVTGHHEVTGITPASSPAVFDNVIIFTTISTISNGQDTMVKLSRGAGGFVVDSRGIHLERAVGSINGNRDWARVDRAGEGTLIPGGNISETGDGSSNFVSFEAATVGSSRGIRIRGFSVNSLILDNILECLVH